LKTFFCKIYCDLVALSAFSVNGAPFTTVQNSGGSRPGVWGAVKLGRAKNVFTCLNTKGCLRQKRLSFVGQKVAIFVGRTMLFFRE